MLLGNINTDTDMYVIGQFGNIILAKQYIGRTLMDSAFKDNLGLFL